MPKLSIDRREVEVPPGATILDAARALGIDVPTLCFLKGYKPATSCLVCVVKLRNGSRVVPSCGTVAVDGMEVESETEEVHHLRRTALELLLSDHLGDCLAPCYFACPAHMDVPLMLRQLAGEDYHEAIATVKRDIALPAVLGRVCPKPCEKACRRSSADGAVAVCQLKRFAADTDLASGQPYVPALTPPTGKRVAVVGAGPTGLSAAYFLSQKGHAVTLFDDQASPGGRLRHEFTPTDLPRDVLDAEIASLLRAGIELKLSTRIGRAIAFEDLRSQFDAVLIACGGTAKDQDAKWNVEVGPRGIHVVKETFATTTPGVFAAGNAIRTKGMVVRSAADGKEAAESIHQFLAGQIVTGPHRPFSTRIGRLDASAMPHFLSQGSDAPRHDPADPAEGFPAEAAIEQASRCLHCDCQGLDRCRLRTYAAKYGADPARYLGPRRDLGRVDRQARVIYEPGKCINCGLCVQIAETAQETLGITFIGRGFDVRVGVPFGRSWDEALARVAAECAAACPTAALTIREHTSVASLPIIGQ